MNTDQKILTEEELLYGVSGLSSERALQAIVYYVANNNVDPQVAINVSKKIIERSKNS